MVCPVLDPGGREEAGIDGGRPRGQNRKPRVDHLRRTTWLDGKARIVERGTLAVGHAQAKGVDDGLDVADRVVHCGDAVAGPSWICTGRLRAS